MSEAEWHVRRLVCHGHAHEVVIFLALRDILCAIELATAKAVICAKSKMAGLVAVQSGQRYVVVVDGTWSSRASLLVKA
ncbi:hypothetical protein KC360_g220 [Hortaea werneckii]|nr:hypothetical protein KC360_g220 [Hortaea werneckii]